MRDTKLERLRAFLDEAVSCLERRNAEIARLRATVSFFTSVIKSGEPWSTACEQMLRDLKEFEKPLCRRHF